MRTDIHTLIYRFRAEVISDADRLVALIPEKEIVRFESLRRELDFGGDCEIEVKSFSLEMLRALCRKVQDGHVMLQTIQPKERYTGERDWELR